MVDIKVEVSNKTTGAELKEIFRKKAKFPSGTYTFRIFFSGSEIKDDQTLGQHKIQSGFKLQIMKFGGPSNNDNKPSKKEEKPKSKKKKSEDDSEENDKKKSKSKKSSKRRDDSEEEEEEGSEEEESS